MLALLLVFAIASILCVPLGRLIGGRVFYVATLVPLAAFVHAALLALEILAVTDKELEEKLAARRAADYQKVLASDAALEL